MTCWGKELIIDVDGDEHQELDERLDERTGNSAQWDNETGEVDLAEDTGVGGEDVAATREAGAEVTPEDDACHIEEWLRGTIGTDACQTAEDEHVHDGGEDGLDDVPKGTEDGLLVLGDDVTLDVHDVEVAVVPEAFEVDVKEAAAGGDYVLLHRRYLLRATARSKLKEIIIMRRN